MEYEEILVEMQAKLDFIKSMREELIDSKVPESIKKTILKTAFNG